MPELALLITCEHAFSHVPTPWQQLFAGREELLLSHRAYDPGALAMARVLAKATAAPLFTADITRLLIDHNRSPHHRNLWSEFSRPLPAEQKHALLVNYYQPYRQAVGEWIQSRRELGQIVIHLSVHSFTPVLNGEVRRADIGVLYDSRRPAEASFGRDWRSKLEKNLPALRVRLNTPYLGRSDCHMSAYRKRFTSAAYLGIELEINQALVADEKAWLRQQEQIANSLLESLHTLDITPEKGLNAGGHRKKNL